MSEVSKLVFWILGCMFALTITLGGIVISDSRDRLTRLEGLQESDRRIFNERNERIVRLEQQGVEILRRLTEIQASQDRQRWTKDHK